MRRFAYLLALFVVLPCRGQSYPDVDALLEMAFATDPAIIAHHLPLELMNAVQQMSAREQVEFERDLMITEKLKGEHVVFTRSEVPPGLVEVRKEGESAEPVGSIYLEKRVCD